MPPNNAPIFGATPNVVAAQFTNSSGTTAQTLNTAGAYGTKVTSLACTSDYTSAVAFDLLMYNGNSDYHMGTVMVSPYAGFNGTTPATNLLDMVYLQWLDATGEMLLPSGYSLKAKLQNTLGSGYEVNVISFGVDY